MSDLARSILIDGGAARDPEGPKDPDQLRQEVGHSFRMALPLAKDVSFKLKQFFKKKGVY